MPTSPEPTSPEPAIPSSSESKCRVIAITGAGGGIGRAFVEAFRAAGDLVVAADLRQESLEIYSDDDGVLAVPTDISSDADIGRMRDAISDAYGRVDVLVHCAGVMPVCPLDEIDPDRWRQTIDINLTGPFLVTRALLPLMTGLGWGRLIFIGSGTVFRGTPNQVHYIAAKAGLIGLSRALSTELGRFGITSNLVTPGITLTEPVLRDFSAEDLAQRRAGRSIQRDMHPSDLVGAVRFLASRGADFITGQILNVDGGNNKY